MTVSGQRAGLGSGFHSILRCNLLLLVALTSLPTSIRAVPQQVAKVDIDSVRFSGGPGDYTLSVEGHGFGTPSVALPFRGDTPNFRIGDKAKASEWGYAGDAYTLKYLFWSDTNIVVSGFGGGPGDAVILALWNASSGAGATWGGNVPGGALAPRIRWVRLSGGGKDLHIVVRGEGFGPPPADLPPPGSPGHSRYFSFQDFRGHCGFASSLFSAGGRGWDTAKLDAVGLVFESWSDTEIVISGFGDGYGAGCATHEAGDPVAVAVWDTTSTDSTGPQTAWGGKADAPQVSAEVQVPPPAQGTTCAEFAVENTLIGDRMYPVVAWSPGGQLIASVSGPTVWLRDPGTGRVVRALRGHVTNAYFLVFDPDGSMLASASRDGKGIIELWDPRTGSLIRTLDPGDDAWAMAFSPNGRWLASGGAIGPVQLWDVRTGSLLRTFSGHGTWVLSVAFSPDGGVLASGGRDRTIKLWDPSTGSLLRSIANAFSFHVGPQGQTDWPPYAAPLTFSPDGGSIASASGDGKIRVWDSRTGGPIRTLTIPSVSGAKTKFYTDVWSVAFTPDGRCLASGSWDSAIRLWDSNSGALVRTLGGHAGPVRSVAFSNDGRWLVSASLDSSIKLWKRVEAAAERRRSEPAVPGASSAPSVSLGQTVDEVIKILGTPEQIVDLGTRVIYTYKGRKIVFTSGKVTDVGVDTRVREN